MANRSSNRAAIPEAKSALDRFKYEVASEIGVPLKDGYNGDLTSRQNGSVGGYMVKKMIEAQEKQMSRLTGNRRRFRQLHLGLVLHAVNNVHPVYSRILDRKSVV